MHLSRQMLDGVLHGRPFEQLVCQDQGVPPGFIYQVNFPRLERCSAAIPHQVWDKERGCKEISVRLEQALYIHTTLDKPLDQDCCATCVWHASSVSPGEHARETRFFDGKSTE